MLCTFWQNDNLNHTHDDKHNDKSSHKAATINGSLGIPRQRKRQFLWQNQNITPCQLRLRTALSSEVAEKRVGMDKLPATFFLFLRFLFICRHAIVAAANHVQCSHHYHNHHGQEQNNQETICAEPMRHLYIDYPCSSIHPSD